MRLRSRVFLGPLLLLAAACGQWSGAPLKSGEPQAVPLGPGAAMTVGQDARGAAGPATDSWGSTVVVAWLQVEEGAASAPVLAAVSEDAGATFGTPVRVGALPLANPTMLQGPAAGVAAPAPGDRSRAPQVWVRAGLGAAAPTLTWHSRDGGRTFVELEQHQAPPETVFPDGWSHVDGGAPGKSATLRLLSHGSRRSAGVQEVPMPPGAQGDPAVVVDEHGALALAWRERDERGVVSLVVRRAWVDWNAGGGEAPGFDAAYTLARLGEAASSPSIARVPGGVIVSWIDRGPDGTYSVFARRLGMDMTCTRESQPATP